MMFITDGYAGLKSESFQGYCSFLEECTTIILLHCCCQVTVLVLEIYKSMTVRDN